MESKFLVQAHYKFERGGLRPEVLKLQFEHYRKQLNCNSYTYYCGLYSNPELIGRKITNNNGNMNQLQSLVTEPEITWRPTKPKAVITRVRLEHFPRWLELYN
jgi:hypothetical protein